MQMVELAAKDDRIALMGIVKEVGVDDDGLVGFYQDYFDRHPIYNDERWKVYEAMGGRKVGFLGLFRAIFGASSRWKEKGIEISEQNRKTSPWMTGGVMVFDKRGDLVYALEEDVGNEFDMERIEKAINGARNINAAFPEDEGAETSTDTSSTRSDENGTAQ
mmetsp:Transcript_77448/g.116411  ORF Transcript_77448/g.116411 Transcript_77448/m.116411 type:complete len:162 (-) Transcript_77448:127-612(-)